MQIHPAAMAMPSMPDDELRELADDIKANGLLVPIELYRGKVIDGRHRLKACELAGVEPEFVEVDLDGQTPAQYVWSLNGTRRHLTPSQKACVAVELLPEIEKAAKERQGARNDIVEKVPQCEKQRSRDEAAKMVGVNSRYVSDAKKIKEESPKTFDRIKSGELKVTQAKQEVKRETKRKELAAKAEELKQAPKPEDDSLWTIVLGDCCVELPTIKNARLVFADPPYNIGIDYGDGKKADKLPDDEYLGWCDDWLTAAADSLTEDGSLWLLVPDEYAEEFAQMLNGIGLHRRAWIKWYETFGVNCANNFNRTSRHLFYYVVDPKHFVFHADAVTRPSDRQAKYNDKRAVGDGKIWDDVWQIPRLTGNSAERLPDFPTQLPLALLKPIIGCASDPGDLVVDPVCGSGTTGVAAKMLGRRFTGIEKGEKFWEMATVRLATS